VPDNVKEETRRIREQIAGLQKRIGAMIGKWNELKKKEIDTPELKDGVNNAEKSAV
jgi:hypothetical protein